jgi:ribosomal protein S18
MAKGLGKWKGNGVQKAISVKDVDWLPSLKELSEYVTKLSKALHRKIEGIPEIKTQMSC